MSIGRKEVRLNEVCDLITDGTHYSPPNSLSGDYRYITSKNVRRGELDLNDVTYVDPQVHAAIYKRCPVRLGDVLFVKDGVNAGVAAINTLNDEFSMLSSVALVRPDPTKLDNRFLMHWLNSRNTRDRMLRNKSGSAITRLILREINDTKILLPPLNQQKRIAAILDAVDALAVKRRQTLEAFEALVQSTFVHLFGDPVRNSHHLRVGTIEEIVVNRKSDIRCGPFGTQLKVDELVADGIPLFGIENVHDDRFDQRCSKFLTARKARELAAFDVQPGDVLVTRMGTIGRACVVPHDLGEARISYHLFRIRPDAHKCLPEFLAATISRTGTFLTQLRAQAHGAIMAGLNTSDLKTVKFLIPPIALQREYVRRVKAIDQLRARSVIASRELSDFALSLQNRAFRGEL